MAINKLKVVLSFLREINDVNIQCAADYQLTNNEFWDIIDACQDDGLIKDADIIDVNFGGRQIIRCDIEHVKLTIRGLEYLNEKSLAMKTYKGLKEVRSWLPF